MQGDAAHHRGHAKFTHTVMNVVAGGVPRIEVAGGLESGVVGAAEVGGAVTAEHISAVIRCTASMESARMQLTSSRRGVMGASCEPLRDPRAFDKACEFPAQCTNNASTRETRNSVRRNHPTPPYVRLAEVTLYGLRPNSYGVEATPYMERATQFTARPQLSVTLPQWQ